MKKHEKKRVSIICGSMRNSLIIKEQLNSILGEYINFECIDIENSSDSFLGSNLILTSGNKATRIVANSLMDNSEILIMGRTR